MHDRIYNGNGMGLSNKAFYSANFFIEIYIVRYRPKNVILLVFGA